MPDLRLQPQQTSSTGLPATENLMALIRDQLLEIQPTANWDGMMELIDRPVRPGSKPCWQYPVHASLAVGGDLASAVPAASAIFCSFAAIALADDILDDDPSGVHVRSGTGAACNMALAFQALGALVIGRSGLAPDLRALALDHYHRLNLDTGYGQHLDALDLDDEAGYWHMVRHKTPPLFAGGLYLGALCGGASPGLAEEFFLLGETLGEVVQISDDLADALSQPAEPDWGRESGNLAILYARLADHPDRNEFLRVKACVTDPKRLARAQEILVRSGAVSYCVFRSIEAHKRARQTLREMQLRSAKAQPTPTVGAAGLPRISHVEHVSELRAIFDHHAEPLKALMTRTGIATPEDFFES